MIEERIKLAELMGLECVDSRFNDPGSYRYRYPDGRPIQCFNPFTDANDDYACLEWMRENAKPQLQIELLPHAVYYDVGDYARALLETIDD